MCYEYYCKKCDKNHFKQCSVNKKLNGKNNSAQKKCTRSLIVKNITPSCSHSTIGTAEKKFKKIYAKEICVDDDSNFVGPKGDTGLTGSKGDRGIVGPKGDIGDSQLSFNDENALTITGLRDVPCHQLFPVFFNDDTNEISCDGSIISYSELVKIVLKQQQEIDILKSLIK